MPVENSQFPNLATLSTHKYSSGTLWYIIAFDGTLRHILIEYARYQPEEFWKNSSME
jgi:hypothetical protein